MYGTAQEPLDNLNFRSTAMAPVQYTQRYNDVCKAIYQNFAYKLAIPIEPQAVLDNSAYDIYCEC